jgi:hypothetical protein
LTGSRWQEKLSEESFTLPLVSGVRKKAKRKRGRIVGAVLDTRMPDHAMKCVMVPLAEAAHLSLDTCEKDEIARVLAKTKEYFEARNRDKNALGLTAMDLSALAPQ